MAINRKGLFPLGLEWGIRDSEYFMNRVKEEKQRTDRSGTPFSIIVVDFHDLLNNNSAVKFLNGRLKRAILGTIVQATRCTDIKGWYESDTLGLLCPDTDTEGAVLLIEKLQMNLEENLFQFTEKKDLIMDKIILTYSTYPYCMNGECQQTEKEPIALNGNNMRITEYMDQKDYSVKNGKSIWKIKNGFPFIKMDGEILEMDGVCLPIITSTPLKRSLSLGVKRTIDIIGSLVCIIVTLPAMLIIALLIKVTSPGPVFFKQERLGYLGRKFTFLKFRSMHLHVDEKLHESYMARFIEGTLKKDSETKASPVYKLKDDPRITPFGRFLRKTSLDELPQLINIIKGDMSLVGPRPPIPYEVNRYKLWHRKRIMDVKPGLTGLWQVSGRSSTTFEEMVRLDLYYVNHWSLKLDFIILLKTMKALFSMRGAY